MISQNEVEELIGLINNGFELEALSFELDIPIEQLQKYKEQLELRKFVKESIKSGKTQIAIEQLRNFIEKNTDNNIVEKMMLLKLQAYANKTNINESDLKQIEEERKKIGFSREIDEVLEKLQVQIPRRKNSNLKEKQSTDEGQLNKEPIKETDKESEEKAKPNYENIISIYKEEINRKPSSLNTRNILAFAYFRAGKMDEAREELLSLIEQNNSYTAYRQLIHLEHCEGNYEDAKLWAYECLDRFPDSIAIRKKLISIARDEKDSQEIINQLKEIIRIDPTNKDRKQMLKRIEEGR